jgi:hypothetical protein
MITLDQCKKREILLKCSYLFFDIKKHTVLGNLELTVCQIFKFLNECTSPKKMSDVLFTAIERKKLR